MTIDSNSFTINRWHSAEYVEDWITNQEQEEGRKLLRNKLISVIPFQPQTDLHVLDIGAGGGALSLDILSRFPLSQVVCQDFSAPMLTQLKQKLAAFADRTKIVQSDLTVPEWTQSISGQFDLVVSSLVMHTIPGRVKDLYKDILNLVKPGGGFIFADSLAPPGPVLEKIYLAEHLRAHQARIKLESGAIKSLEEIEADIKDKRLSREVNNPRRVRNPLQGTLTMMNHLEWLKQAGFNEVDCLWKETRRAVIGGFKY